MQKYFYNINHNFYEPSKHNLKVHILLSSYIKSLQNIKFIVNFPNVS